MHKRLDEKKTELAEIPPRRQWSNPADPGLKKSAKGDLRQKKLNQSLNGLKNPHYFHKQMLLLRASPVEPMKALPT
ncbi:hypothetical protein [Pseudomonas sp. MPC6]|uniref:hypothetical protein n=1 Tax=unclassified Pseudomonas TaxID=196821 RepID=UPI001110E955|nr:hypothetical protein [Pseudomonas sp. MPC6]QCY12316.1 hypothetical protein ELQ88_16805 [Pseudomonas sp. MPC6]